MGDPYADPSRLRATTRPRFRAMADPDADARHPRRVDHRVPICEALRLWTDLQRHGVAGRFLYFPDENHWILKPQNARIWYGTVLAFLDEHLCGIPFQRDPLLGG